MLGCSHPQLQVLPADFDRRSRALPWTRGAAGTRSVGSTLLSNTGGRRFSVRCATDSGSQDTRGATKSSGNQQQKSWKDALVQRAMAWSFGEKVVAAVAAAGILWAIPRLLLFSLAQMEGVAVVALIGVEEAVAALLLLAFRYLAIGGLFVLAGTVIFLMLAPVAKRALGRDK